MATLKLKPFSFPKIAPDKPIDEQIIKDYRININRFIINVNEIILYKYISYIAILLEFKPKKLNFLSSIQGLNPSVYGMKPSNVIED